MSSPEVSMPQPLPQRCVGEERIWYGLYLAPKLTSNVWFAKVCKRSLYRNGLFVTSRVRVASRPASKPATPSEYTSVINYTMLCSSMPAYIKKTVNT